jgi:hypothetical protein
MRRLVNMQHKDGRRASARRRAGGSSEQGQAGGRRTDGVRLRACGLGCGQREMENVGEEEEAEEEKRGSGQAGKRASE